MHIQAIKTEILHARTQSIEQVLDASLHDMRDGDVLAVTSKAISLCEGAIAPIAQDKNILVESEADEYIPREKNQYGFCISIKNNTIIASAGIDESNGDGFYVLWPRDPQGSVNAIRRYVQKKFSVKHVGVIMTDSHVMPLRWGTVGTCLAYSGFVPVQNYIGKPDLFGRTLKVTKSNIAEGLAAAAVLAMGEGNECTPLALIRDCERVQFVDEDPSQEELASLVIERKDDVFASLLKAVEWKNKSGV